MRWKLPILSLAFLFALSASVLFGGKVKAASIIMYDGTVEFGIARRSFYDQVDFNYATQQFNLPLLGDFGIVDSNAWGLPSAFSGVTYNNIPMYVAVNCPQLALDGGYLYVTFMVCYFNGDGISNLTFTQTNRGGVYQYSAGSLDRAIANGTRYSSSIIRTTTNSNTVLTNPTPASTGEEVIHVRELNLPSGVNFPKCAIFDLDDSEGTLEAYGLTDAYILGYSETADENWIKSNTWTYRITVPEGSSNINSVFWWDFSNFISGSFTPVSFNDYTMQTNAGIYFIQSTLSGSKSNCVYLCPVSAFACSQDSYEPVEAYLADISNSLSNITSIFGDSVSQSVLESYAAMGSAARQAAEDAVAQMSYAAPSYNASDYDIMDNVDDAALAQFKSVFGFLNLGRIIPIILAVFAICTISYVFFGKKG